MQTNAIKSVGEVVLYKGDRCHVLEITEQQEYVCTNLDNNGYEVWLTDAILAADKAKR